VRPERVNKWPNPMTNMMMMMQLCTVVLKRVALSLKYAVFEFIYLTTVSEIMILKDGRGANMIRL